MRSRSSRPKSTDAVLQVTPVGDVERGDGAILSAQGASAVRGVPRISGGLYIGAAIKHTPFYERREAERAAGTPVPRTYPRLIRTISPAFSGPCTARRASRKPPTPRVFRLLSSPATPASH